jgi:DNA-binding NarL/FixJ family response regulator
MRVLLVDDHPMVRESLAHLQSTEPDIEVVGGAEHRESAADQTRALQPDVVVLDVTLPIRTGIAATRALCDAFPGVYVIGLSVDEAADRAVVQFAAGAKAYVSKMDLPRVLLAAIRAAATSPLPDVAA